MSDDYQDEFIYLTEEEFVGLDDENKLSYIRSFMSQLKIYKAMAETNCEECIHYLQTVHDVNIDLFFDDWRGCTDNCNECTKADQVEMCKTQFEIMSHLANEVADISDKLNKLIKFNYVKTESGAELYEDMKEAVRNKRRVAKNNPDMFQ